MARKGGLRNVAKKQAENKLELSEREQKIIGVVKRSHVSEEEPHVNLKYYDPSYECFSAWTSDELSAFSKMLAKLVDSDWTSINNTGGKRGHKVGFGYTIHKNTRVLPKTHPRLSKLSPEITFFEMRVTSTARVHGFRVREAFFLVWLDRNHQIYPE